MAFCLEKLLEELSMVDGPPGREGPVRKVLDSYVRPYADDVYEDTSGNLIAQKKGKGEKKILVSTHMDEVGMIVSKVLPEGFLRVEGIGIDPKICPSQKVRIHTKQGVKRGVIGMLAPHLQTEETRKLAANFDTLFVDVSMHPDLPFRVGDFVTLDSKPMRLGKTYCGKALDNRASCAASVIALMQLQKRDHFPDLFFVFSSREEVGAFGACTASKSIQPDLGIAIDVTHGNESVPNTSKIELGKGPALAFGPVIQPALFKAFQAVAEKNGIAVQTEAVPGRSGTDADMIQLEGIPSMVISIPQRYMHNPIEMIHLKDIEETGRLLACFLSEWEG